MNTPVQQQDTSPCYYKRILNTGTGLLSIFLDEDIHENTISIYKERGHPIQNDRSSSSQDEIPESVLQYERQLSKVRAMDRTKTPVQSPNIVYIDNDIIVANKPSGTLCVPGVHNRPSLLHTIYDIFGGELPMDKMVVHRLDMDTSGIVVFARTERAMVGLHESFRDHKVTKRYEALLCGHLNPTTITQGKIDLPLQRDHRFPPFQRIATAQSEAEAQLVVKDLQHAGYRKLIKKKPKKSITEFEIVGKEELLWDGGDALPVTRVALIPVTGRTHQLRVHCAAMGYPIVADSAYGLYGEASPNGGLDLFPQHRASIRIQKEIHALVRKNELKMCLHSKRMKFPHPVTNEVVTFDVPSPF